jgi:hypothetical protein
MKNAKFVEAEQVSLEQIDSEWLRLKLADKSFVIDVDTLYDLTFRCAQLLAKLEEQEEILAEEEELPPQAVCLCGGKVH